jgi:hypothetical protein
MIFCAFSGSPQKAGPSASVFSSDSRFSAFCGSKMPPQQSKRLLDGIDIVNGFGFHGTRMVQGGRFSRKQRPLLE